ncbi:MAG: DUF1292 domain-containing protein [Acholeplasmataceae bacterium]|nr:DUF1292 domain-containing protein [Acholeplasmataceae bacterium]
MLKDNQIVVTDDKGNETVCEILFTHDANGKSYVVFEFPEDGDVSAAIYVPSETDEEGSFIDIETDEEWDLLDKVLQAYYDDLDNEEDEEDADDDLLSS